MPTETTSSEFSLSCYMSLLCRNECHCLNFNMVQMYYTRTLVIKLCEGLAVSHVALNNGADLASLPVAEHPDSAVLCEEEINFLQ